MFSLVYIAICLKTLSKKFIFMLTKAFGRNIHKKKMCCFTDFLNLLLERQFGAKKFNAAKKGLRPLAKI